MSVVRLRAAIHQWESESPLQLLVRKFLLKLGVRPAFLSHLSLGT